MYVSYDKNNVITAISKSPFKIKGQFVKKTNLPIEEAQVLIGKQIVKSKKPIKDLKVAVICNWGDACGIATYSKFLFDEIKKKVADLRIFAEHIPNKVKDEPNVIRCWQRGHPTKELTNNIIKYDPDFIIIQHEFGIFPKATYFLQLLQSIENYPYVLTLHSVYEHLDKAVCTSAIRNIVVHTKEGKEILEQTGNTNNIFIVPHGCVKIPEEQRTELWNIFQTPYAIVQFGFGFFYKGVDTAIEAIALLKKTQPEKYKEIFYCYLCSESPHSNNIHTNYFNLLSDKIKDLGVENNVCIIRKYQSEQTINNYLRTAKLALFPYKSDPNNTVYGASGAVRIAMANGCPIVAGSNHQFDDLEGVLPRASTPEKLAEEIDKVFSSEEHRKGIVARSQKYINENTWSKCADKYLELYEKTLPAGVDAKII
jgi:glycosyltransferase involved in cell wall biosynthesis